MRASCLLFILCACLCGEALCAVGRELFECRPGTPYVENECNTCFCLESRELVCTMKRCPENQNKEVESCSPGLAWQNDCNKCWCVNLGIVCTNHKCNNVK